MDLHELYKNHYFFELSRKDQLASAVTIPAGLLTIIGGAIVTIAHTIDMPFTRLEISELILLGLATVCVFISIYFLIRSYFHYGYGFIATTLEIKKYKEELEDYYQGTKKVNKKVNCEIEEFINNQYVKHTDLNTRNNDRKSSYIHKANWALILSLVFTILTGIPFVIKSAIDSEQVYKVEILERKQGINIMSKDKKDSGSQKKPQQPSNTSDKSKPTPPRGRVILEDFTPPVKDIDPSGTKKL